MIEYENLAKVNAPFFPLLQHAFERVMRRGWYILGEEVESFEREFAAYCGVSHCVGTASGLDALILALRAADLPRGSEVLVPSNTYIATILSIVHAGMKPVLVEPDIRTYNIDPCNIEKAITPKTKALMVVHLYGRPCDMDPILALSRRYGLTLVEDCAQAHGATYKGKRVGSFGDFGAFSFYPTKNLGGLGDGGCVTTNNPQYADRLRALRNYGSKVKYHNEVVGYNSRLDEVQAAFLRVKLKRLEEINQHKRRLAGIYLASLKSDFVLPAVDEGYGHVFHIFNIRHPERDRLREYLYAHGVKTEIHYPIPPQRQPALKGIVEGDFPVSSEIHRTTLSLPISFCHTESEVEKVCEIMNAF